MTAEQSCICRADTSGPREADRALKSSQLIPHHRNSSVAQERQRKERRGTERESFLVSSLFTKGDEQGEKKHATRNITNQKNK